MNNPIRKQLGLLVIYPLLLSPVLFFLIWLMLGKPIYSWDSGWYRNIVDYGYDFNGDITVKQDIAFLPGYPLIIKVIAVIFGFSSVVAQLIVCLLGYLVGSWFFFKVISLRIGEYLSAIIVMIWSLMPFSIYFMNGYSESVLFALVGVFFYFLQRGSVVSASIVISYGLITRPHAMAMLPVLFYYLYRFEHCKGVFSWYQSLGRAGVKSVELAPIIIIFPVILTIYWYLSFGDSLVNKNIYYAWSHGVTPTLVQKFNSIAGAISSIFSGLQYSNILIYKKYFYTLSPQQFAAFFLVTGLLLTPVFLAVKCYDFFIFNISIVILWIISSDILNLGRHISLMFSIPFAGVIALDVLISRFRVMANDKTKMILYFFILLTGFIYIVSLCLSGIHFIWFAIRYLNVEWVS